MSAVEGNVLTPKLVGRQLNLSALATFVALLARVSVLINNAGLAAGFDTLQTGKLDDWDATIDTNVKGLLYVTHALLPHFVERNDGHIINMGSVAGYLVYPKGNVYCASKHAVRAINESLRIDLLGSKIRVTAVSPGMVETEFSVVRMGDQKKADAIYAGMTPLTAQDIAETIHWCARRPKHVNIQDVIIYPTDQAQPTLVSRGGKAP
jgi:NADP-dependent 3-hydroxy acid dehydrogenase YdfG